ncbi:MAG TPA: hypothetical protein PKL55_06920 [Syntrophales bacterium]|nr:hypothetical protein [Syntrophales bacterium]
MKRKIIHLLVFVFWVSMVGSVWAEDSEVSRGTLAGLQGVGVFVENTQANVQKYAQKAGIDREAIQRETERCLAAAGIKVVAGEEWRRTPGNPFLYVSINTHETEKYWYAYDIKVEVRQVVYLEANPKVRTMATTWSMNMTGMANIGNLHIVRNDAMVLVERFVAAYRAVNKGR